jgi:hypothetical protein
MRVFAQNHKRLFYDDSGKNFYSMVSIVILSIVTLSAFTTIPSIDSFAPTATVHPIQKPTVRGMCHTSENRRRGGTNVSMLHILHLRGGDDTSTSGNTFTEQKLEVSEETTVDVMVPSSSTGTTSKRSLQHNNPDDASTATEHHHEVNDKIAENDVTSNPTHATATSSSTTLSSQSFWTMLFPQFVATTLRSSMRQYSHLLQHYPIRTKSITACILFAMSDLVAQSYTRPDGDTNHQKQQQPQPQQRDNNLRKFNNGDSKVNNSKMNDRPISIVWSRVLSSAAVGLCYFGPAAHYWYYWIFKLLPSTTFVSTMQKAILGQVFFGPSFTCLFFAISLLQSQTFTIANWMQKIRTDLPSVWLAGAGFWST